MGGAVKGDCPSASVFVGSDLAQIVGVAAVAQRYIEVLKAVVTELLLDRHLVRENAASGGYLGCADNGADLQRVVYRFALLIINVNAVKALVTLVTLNKALVQNILRTVGFKLRNEVVGTCGQVALVVLPVKIDVYLLIYARIAANEPQRLDLARCGDVYMLRLFGVGRCVEVALLVLK